MTAYDRLIETLDAEGARSRVIGHEPEARTETAGAPRGDELFFDAAQPGGDPIAQRA